MIANSRRLRRPRIPAAVFILAGLVVLVWPEPARAYLDPGSGSYMLQLLLASMFGLAIGIKLFWRQFKARIAGVLFRRPSKLTDDQDKTG